ncbi:hypothetical protein N0V90_003154 [Kalmusia sp. IMI 367209]|nr:hypothetical protein N0V90_003154 [Kalmusia sp. IMI 367209]
MAFEQGHLCTQNTSLAFQQQQQQQQQYQYGGGNLGFPVSNDARGNPRVYPPRASIGGARVRSSGSRDDDPDSDRSRRRVPVAVGSGEASSVIDLHHSLNGYANSFTMMHACSAPTSPLRPRPSTYPGMGPKPIYPHSWAISFAEETSPVDMYGPEQHTAYLSSEGQMASNGDHRWSTDSKPAHNTYIAHDPTVYDTYSLPCMEHNVRTATSSEALSHSMRQLTLPERPHTRSGVPPSQRPQLPIPHQSPAQTSRNVVDQLQDQRLRSAQAMSGSSLGSGGFVKPPPPLHGNTDVKVTVVADKSATLPEQVSVSSTASTSEGLICPSTKAPTTVEELSLSNGPQFHFSTSAIFDAVPAPTLQPTYSNFRETRDKHLISPTSLYSISTNSNSRGLPSENDSTLVSGQQYTPLSQCQNQPQHQSGLNGLPNETLSRRHMRHINLLHRL